MKRNIVILIIISLLAAASGVLIMTDMGQIFGISKETIVFYFKYNSIIIGFSFLILLAAYMLNRREQALGKKVFYWSFGLWVFLVLCTKFITPYVMFPATQHGAEFIPKEEVKDYLNDQDIVFVVDYNGVQKAYPRTYLWQTHIVGGDFEDENIVFTYCVLTNLPAPFINDIEGEEVNFKVLAQTNNNLLIWDRESGEIIQQITQTCEFSENRLEPVPVLEMTWEGFKKAYPQGTVFYNEWDTPMEKMLNVAMDTDANWNSDSWMFKTVNFEDTRFESKEQVIGITDHETGDQLAISKDHIRKAGKIAVNVGGKNLLLVYFPEYETIAAFDLLKDGTVLDPETIGQISLDGITDSHGQLSRAYIYNSVFWGVWCYYYPETEVLT